MSNKSMNCLVTGGAGFIGSHLVERLLSDNHKVVVVDNFSTGRIQNLSHLQSNPNLRIEKVDVTDGLSLAPLLKGVDWVFHMAALADIVPSINEPLRYFHNNVAGTTSMLEASRKANVKRFVYTASDSSYGIPTQFPTPESESIKPQYPYALTKYLGEVCSLHFAQVYKLPVISLRLANVFGPRSRTTGAYGGVFGVFLAQKLAGKPYTVVGDGTQSRDFTYVTDVVQAFILAAESNLSGEVFNVGSGVPQSVNRLIELLGQSGGIVTLPKRPGEPDYKKIDTCKIRSLLGWAPVVSFEEGIGRMLEEIDHWRDAPVWTKDSIEKVTQDWFRYLGPNQS